LATDDYTRFIMSYAYAKKLVAIFHYIRQVAAHVAKLVLGAFEIPILGEGRS